MAANSGNDLQITLVKSHQNPRRPTGNNEKKSSSTQPLPSSLLAAANAFSKMSPMSHFANGGFSLPGVDITPASLPHPMPQSASTRNLGKSSSSGNLPGNLPPAGNSMTGLASSLLPMFDPVYFQALYAANANPLNFQNFNLLPPELLKLYQNSIPSSKS